MKTTKKFIVALMAVVAAFALAVPTLAWAQTEALDPADADNASITIMNPASGETYTLFKLFDATVDGNGKIAYQGTIPSSLSDYFEVITGADGSTNYVKLKDGANENALFTALETWAGSATATASAKSNGDTTLAFTGLPYGYYVVTTTHKDSTTGKAAITVDSTNPNAEIYDKNATKVVAEEKKADDTSYSIGDTITFTAKFSTTNYVGSGSTAGKVYKYVISDTLPEYLSNVTVTNITVGGTAITTQQFSDKKITIDWVDSDGKSLYANGAEIVVTYTAVLTSTVNVNAANKNTITITPYDKDGKPYDESDSTYDEITTYAAALKKTDGTNALAGAKFAFYGLTVEKTADGVYTVTGYDSESTTLGTEMEVGSDGLLYVVGLGADDKPVGVETVAPDGYNKLTTTVTLTPQVLTKEVYKATETRYYDADGNLVSTEASSSFSKDVEKNLSELDAASVEVVNQAGTELPSTGGIGTTIFYILGAILVIGAGVVLITKRRVAVARKDEELF